MKIKSLATWLFVYLPVRFTIPFLGLLAWFLFYLWPWLLDVAFPNEPGHDIRDLVREQLVKWLVPGWVDTLNLTPALKAVAVLGLLGVGILAVYNAAAIWYRAIRRWRREAVLVGTLTLNIFFYSYPWLFAPKDWNAGNYFLLPFYFRKGWMEGFSDYGVLWLLPVVIILGTLSFELLERRRLAREKIAAQNRPAELPPVENPSFDKLRTCIKDLRIGVILSGGGAKGVYQAGALRAIHEFLKQHNCISNVKMIAGTSIGSWNSMFWLADLMEPQPGKKTIEDWWKTTNVGRIIDFDTYIPFLKNSMLTPTPWKENFKDTFEKTSLAESLENRDRIHFYLTRSNVAQGRLEFATNWGAAERERALQSEDIQVDSFNEAQTFNDIRDAVFASMDLPPLFPYQKMGYELFEDGGVIDNLPIRFGAFVEDCDLLFVLALNSSFEGVPNQRSMLARMMRVMDVRQGVLERNSMRLAYLYNHINVVTNSTRDAASKVRKLVRVFAICPDQPLEVNTSEFWKTDRFETAFLTMYNATRVELSHFNFTAEPAVATEDRKDWLRMALVSPAGEITYNYRF